MPFHTTNTLTMPPPNTLKTIPNVVKTSPQMTLFMTNLTGPRTFIPTPPHLPLLTLDFSPLNRASNNIVRVRPYIRGITPPCEEYGLRERENDGYMGPVWDDDRTGMYHPSEKAARRLEKRLGVGEDVERVRRRKRGVYYQRRRREREVEREREREREKGEERARAEGGEGEGDGERGERGGSGGTDEGDGEEVEEQEVAPSASESEPRTSLLVTLATTSETGKACLQALGVAGGRRTRKRFYEQPAEQSAAGPSSRKKARKELPDDEASTQMCSAMVPIPTAPTLEPMEKGKDAAEVSTSFAGALTDTTLVETHEITPMPAGQFKDKAQDEVGQASSVLTDNGKDDTEVFTSSTYVVAEESLIDENAASSKPAEQSTDEIQGKADKVPPSLTWKTSHKKQTKLDEVFGISRGKSNCKKQSKIDKLFPVVKSKPRREVFCTCRRPEFGFMIYCEGPCGEWYHGRCVGITASEAKKMDKYFCKSCTAPPAAAADGTAVEVVASRNTVEPMTAPDPVVEEAPKSATPAVQVEPNTAHVKDLKSTTSVTPAPTLQDVITARLKYFSPSSVTRVTMEKPTAVQQPMVLTTHAPSSNAEDSFAQALHTFTTLRGGAIRFNFGACKDIFED